MRAYAITSLPVPPISSDPAPGSHRTALMLLASVHTTTLVSPVKHASLTIAEPWLSGTRPAHTIDVCKLTFAPPKIPTALIESFGVFASPGRFTFTSLGVIRHAANVSPANAIATIVVRMMLFISRALRSIADRRAVGAVVGEDIHRHEAAAPAL